jgi:uncharacterized membrane protein
MLLVTFYDILKFGHVALAIAWIGGGLMLSILAEFALRSKIPGRAAEFAREVGLLGQRFFTPVSLAVLGLGFWLVHRGHWGYETWVIVSLVGYGLSFAIGAGFLGPQSTRLSKLIESEGPDAPAVKASIRTLVTVARFDSVILFTIVFFMVTKIGQ